MILTVGLSPAWQHVLVLNELVPGEVNRAEEAHWFASGKVLNAARALHHLECPTTAVTFLGGGHGQRVEEDLRGLRNLRLRAVWTSSPTRVCTTLVVRRGASTTELVENAGAVTDEEAQELVTAFREESRGAEACVLIGSLPRGCPVTVYRDLLEAFRGPSVVDARGPELLEALPMRPTVVKPNREELERTLDRKLDTVDDIFRAAAELRRRGAQWVIVSRGREPLCASGPDGDRCLVPPRVEAVNPIGSGDCLSAGVAWALIHGWDVPDAIRFGMGAAAQNATALRTSELEPDTVRRLAGEVRDL